MWSLYTGSYLGPYTGLAEIQVVDEQLALNLNGEQHPLHALKKDLYFARKPEGEVIASVGFPAEEAGPVQFLVVNSSPCKRIEQDASFTPDPADLRAYVGKYASEVGVLTITTDDGHLYAHEENKRVICVALSRTRFACEWGLLDFHIAEDGAVPSFTFGETFTFARVSS
ncbi:MAG: hypothetical protein M3Y81_27625 [Chloroflexota bacterium]|nr:hypothetical protein [Chloroflexota bacterium]